MYSFPRRHETRLNLVFALAVIFCVGIWIGVGYALGTVL